VRDTSKISSETGLVQMMRMVSSGDSILIDVSVNDYYKDVLKRPLSVEIDTTLTLTYRIKIDTIMGRDDSRKLIERLAEQKRQRKVREACVSIDKFILEHSISAEKEEPCMRYVLTKKVSKVRAKSKQTVRVNYAGYLLDGTCFATNIRSVAEAKGIYSNDEHYEPVDIVIDESPIVDGWHSALKHLGVGDKGTFYIPSQYSQQIRNVMIKEYDVLIFEIELLSNE
jgi:FKBP-type peptidyl-prolyl cis-trans isomerase